MRRTQMVVGLLVAAGTWAVGATAAFGQTIAIGSASGAPGSLVTINVTLQDSSMTVAGTQNTIDFDPNNAPVNVKANGKPDCKVNPDLADEGGTSFAFQPAGCSGAACTAVKALVFATDSTEPIAATGNGCTDPSNCVMYTCNIAISASAAGGNYALTNDPVAIGASNSAGGKITIAGTDGTITVTGGVSASPTATTGSQPSPTPTLSSSVQAILIGSASGAPGSLVTINVTLQDSSMTVAGTQNTIDFDPNNAPINVKANGKPDCKVNPDLADEGGTSFAFQPAGCSGAACTAVKALVFATDSTEPIAATGNGCTDPTSCLMYTCNVAISASAAPGNYVLTNDPVAIGASDSAGGKITVVGTNGIIIVTGPGGAASPTPTTGGVPPTATVPAATATAKPTSTPVPATPTSQPAATHTSAPAPTASATSVPSAVPTEEDEGGCQISASRTSNAGWLLLIPVAGLLVIRRRSH